MSGSESNAMGSLGLSDITPSFNGSMSDTSTQGSSSFTDMMKSPMFQKYLANMGAGMQNQRDFGSALSSGLSSANKGLSQDISNKIIQEEALAADEEKYRKLQEAMKSYGLVEMFNKLNMSQLYSSPKTVSASGLLKGK